MVESVITVNPISSACLFVEMLCNGHKLACGTAFYYCHDGSRYLISNWHNYSGREPSTRKPKDRQAALPDQLKVHGRDQDNLAESKPIVLDLVDSNGSFLWLHHPEHEGKIDIGVLPVSNELGIDDIDITTAIHEIDPHENWPTEVGEQLFVVGFPFGLSDTCNLPIWKAATLASEPEIDQEGLPLLYIDTATRKGMSGSPVIKYRRRSVSLITEESLYRFHAEFIGVYSGRIVPEDMFEAQIGKVWRAKCIDEIIKGGHFYLE